MKKKKNIVQQVPSGRCKVETSNCPHFLWLAIVKAELNRYTINYIVYLRLIISFQIIDNLSLSLVMLLVVVTRPVFEDASIAVFIPLPSTSHDKLQVAYVFHLYQTSARRGFEGASITFNQHRTIRTAAD